MRKSLERITAATFALFFCVPLGFAQSDAAIRGVVVAKADNSSVPDADIRLEGSFLPEPLRTKTTENGQFVFQRLVPGQYELAASGAGFQEQRVQFTLKPRE